MSTGLKVSSFACKYLFYRPEHNARRGLHKTEFSNAKMKQPTNRARRADEKNGVILSTYHGYFIVIRNEKIVWKVVWIDYYLRLNLSFKRY